MSPSTSGPQRIRPLVSSVAVVRQRIHHPLVMASLFLLTVGAIFLAPSSSFSSLPSSTSEKMFAYAYYAAPPLSSRQFLTPPVVGIFSQPLSKNAAPVPNVWRPWDGLAASATSSATATATTRNRTNDQDSYYIAASYHKWLESGGMLVLPIPYDAEPSLLDELLSQIQLLFLPGGDATLAPSIQYLLNRIDGMNRNGIWFPVWGTCLGMEFLVSHFGQIDPLTELLDAENMTLPLEHVVPGNSALYDSSRHLYEIVTNYNVTFNNHRRGISPTTFQSNRLLTQRWKITSTNVDRVGKPFVSTIEPLHDQSPPYYGTQYHPEKNAFEYGLQPSAGTTNGPAVPFEVIDHTPEGLHLSRAIAHFVGRLARKSQRRNFERRHAYTRPDRFPPLHTYPTRPSIGFEQIYLVPSAAAWKRIENGGAGVAES